MAKMAKYYKYILFFIFFFVLPLSVKAGTITICTRDHYGSLSGSTIIAGGSPIGTTGGSGCFSASFTDGTYTGANLHATHGPKTVGSVIRTYSSSNVIANPQVPHSYTLTLPIISEVSTMGTITVCTKEDPTGDYLSGSKIYYLGSNYLGSTAANGCFSTSLTKGTYAGYNLYATHDTRIVNGAIRMYNSSDAIPDPSVPGNYTLNIPLVLTNVRIIVTSCNTGDPITSYTLHFGSFVANVNDSGGQLYIPNVIPDLYQNVYISASGYANSNAQDIIVNSQLPEKVINICCNEPWGSFSASVHDNSATPQAIGGASLCVDGVQQDFSGLPGAVYPSNALGQISLPQVGAGTYTGVTVCGVAGMEDANSPVNITIPANETVSHVFTLKPIAGMPSLIWNSPADGDAIAKTGMLHFSLSAYPPDAGDYNVIFEFIMDSTIVYTYNSFISGGIPVSPNYYAPAEPYSVGPHTAGAQWTYEGTTYPLPDRTISITNQTYNLSGTIRHCNKDGDGFWIFLEGLSGAIVDYGSGSTISNDPWGDYSVDLAPGTYNVFAMKTNYQNSVTQTVNLTEDMSGVDFCLQTTDGSLAGYVENSNGVPQDGVDIYIGGTWAANTASFAITGQPGWFGAVGLAAGTINNVVFKKGSWVSPSYDININTNETTSLNPIILSDTGGGPSPTLTVSLSAVPPSADVPFTADLTTTLGGTAVGAATYSAQDCGGGTLSEPSGGTFKCTYTTANNYTASITVTREGITRMGSTVITATAPAPTADDIGLRVRDNGTTVSIAVEPLGTLTSPLRIRKGGNTYGIILVDTTDANATHFWVKTSAGIKALKKY